MDNNNNITRDQLKELLSFLESSSGKNLDHRTMASGTHKDYSAYGQYGLMPITTKEFAAKLYDKLSRTKGPTPVQMLTNPTPEQIKADQNYIRKMDMYQKLRDFNLTPKTQDEFKKLITPEMEDDITNAILDRIAKKAGPSRDAALINWEKGQNLKAPTFRERMQSGRVMKSLDYLEEQQKKNKLTNK